MHELSYQFTIFQQKLSRKWHEKAGLGTALAKTDIVRMLAQRWGLETYLELCTRLTGNFYHALDRSAFAATWRLMYNCPVDFSDGLPIDYRTDGFDIAPLLAQLARDQRGIDICLIDGWHTYDCARRDMRAVYDLLPEGGVMVVHDVLPPASIVSPSWHPGAWCGVAYRAYLDFVLAEPGVDYRTVNADFGCGIVAKGRSLQDFCDLRPVRPELIAGWRAIPPDADAFPFFARHHRALLRVISPRAFMRRIADRALSRERPLAMATAAD